jgi:hypothetical protein
MGLVEKIAEENFAGADAKNLVRAVYEKINDENMFDFFTSSNKQIRRVVAKRIYENLYDAEFVKRIIEGLNQKDRAEGILAALSHAQLRKNPAILQQIETNLQSEDEKIQEAAATVIAYQYPEEAIMLVPLIKKKPEIAKIACYSANPEILFPVMKRYPQQLPPFIGMLLTPYWLARNYKKRPEIIAGLIDQFGYSDAGVSENVLALLKRGFMFVSKEMAAKPAPYEWRDRLQEFTWALLPDCLGMKKKPVAVNLEDKIDTALFLAAARESDVINIQAKKDRDPFSYRADGIDVAISHSYYRYFKRKLIGDALELADKLKVVDKGGFLVDHARVLLETNHEANVEADVLLRTKWLALSKAAGFEPNPKKFPITDEEDYPLAKFAVIDRFTLPKPNHRLSAGANAVVNVAEYFHIKGVGEKLEELEGLYSKFLLPVGIELQIPKSETNTSLAYKQALRYFGIPSPRRPEYFEMIEAAFRPARSFHSMALGIILMHRIGLMKCEQDMAYHISVQGNLKDNVRYIAFPNIFMNRPRRKIENQLDRFYRMARLMSKGFVNINKDVEPSYGTEKPECRTEMRVFCCQTDDIDGESRLNLACIDQLVSAHLLASASVSPNFADIWDKYKNQIIEYANALPSEFAELLNGNWFEATGDPRDGNLVAMLPIIQKKEAVSEIIKEKGMAEKLEGDFARITAEHARAAHDRFAMLYAKDYDFSGFCRCSFGIPYFVPDKLRIGITEMHFS